jgi:ribosomal protein S18 acetylase RimI-like enzyme
VPDPFPGVAFRAEAAPQDRTEVEALVRQTGFFSPAEVAIAVELVDDRLRLGPDSDYEFVFAGRQPLLGYACWGAIPGTEGSVDLYWIAVAPEQQGRGVGQWLMAEFERRARLDGAQRVFVDTSGRAQYEPTRKFYLRCGYDEVARIEDFYASGDPKVVLRKRLDPPVGQPARRHQ